jgi:serine-type D-Ala-D-Ala carboxypeptidase (penicillin-binding protein 5/6)
MPFSRIATAALLAICCAAAASQAATYDVGERPSYAAAVLMEAETGTVLFEHKAHVQRSPASTQKLLLELVVMNQVATGRYSLDDEVLVSARSSRTGGSQVYLKQGEVFPLAELMEAVIIPSANDACVAVAEHLGGSVEGFVDMMNQQARDLGLEHTRCVNVHGLDDTPMDDRNLTTAYDLAQIARALIAYPRILEWSGTRYKPFRDGEFMLYTTNKLLGKYRGMDGLKTGFTQRAKSCLVATARRDSMRLIAVVLGARSERLRDGEISRLLSWGFNNFSRVPLVRAGQLVGTVAMDWGHEPEVRVITQDAAFAVLAPDQEKLLSRSMELPAQHPAPVDAGEGLGKLEIALGDSVLAVVDLVAEKAVRRMTVWEKLVSWF